METSPNRSDKYETSSSAVEIDKRPKFELAELFPFIQDVIDNVAKLRKYLSTRHQILAGKEIWQFGKDALKTKELMGPWEFNLYQSVFSAAPGIVISFFASFLGRTKSDEDVDVAVAVKKFLWCQVEFQCTPNQQHWVDVVISTLKPLEIPLALGIASFAAAYGSLDSWHRSLMELRQQRNAYLYADGAFGLWSQMGLTTALAIFANITAPHEIDAHVSLIKFTFWVATFWLLVWSTFRQLYLTFGTLPKRLFEASGSNGSLTDINGNLLNLVRYVLLTSAITFIGNRVLALFLLLFAGVGVFFGSVQDWLQHSLSVAD